MTACIWALGVVSFLSPPHLNAEGAGSAAGPGERSLRVRLGAHPRAGGRWPQQVVGG